MASTEAIPAKRWGRIIPPAILVYIFGFMDRTNIGFAMAGGMSDALQISICSCSSSDKSEKDCCSAAIRGSTVVFATCSPTSVRDTSLFFRLPATSCKETSPCEASHSRYFSDELGA